jgi:hypothetical protein
MSVCVVCGSSDFGDPHDGLFFCLECGTQSQDVRVEVSQLEDGRGRYTRSLRTKKGKPKKTEGEDTEHSLPLEIFQKVIKRQCDAVVALGFDPSVKEAARLIWFTYLRHYGYAFREEGRSVSGRTQNKLQFCPSSSQPGPSGSGLQFDCGTAALVRVRGRAGRRGQKRPADSASTESSGTVKKTKTAAEATAGYDTFPDDKFLFEDVETANKNKNTTKELKRSQRASETADKSKNTVGKLDMSQAARETMDAAESVRMMESLRSWEELEELERAMDCRQLLAFRQAYLSAHGELKPKFVAETESWGYQPRVFKLRTTVSLLYLALLYTEQPVLPADLIRWVKSEKIPLHTPLEEDDDDSSGNKDKGVLFRTMQTVTTPSVIENAFRLYLHLPLPPLPSPDPRAISHIIIDRLRFTECFKRLVDRAMATVCLPLGFTGRRFDLECAAVIIIMLRILYGLDDCVELDECLTDASGHEDLTTDNSLPVWADWVHIYCTQVSSTSSLDEDAPPNLIIVLLCSRDPRSSKSCQHYLKFCKDVVFSKCRSAPAPGSKCLIKSRLFPF